jgi:hypothetical protein
MIERRKGCRSVMPFETVIEEEEGVWRKYPSQKQGLKN